MKKKNSDPRTWGDATKLVRGGLDRTKHGETSEALFLNSGFVYDEPETAEKRFAGEDDGYVYGRYGNPTVTMFEERLAMLEGAEACYAVASGMAAVFGALACQLKAGDHLVASKALFGSCYQIVTSILPRFGIKITLVDGKDLNAWKEAIASETKCVFLETPSNPGLEVIDLDAVCAIAKAKGAKRAIMLAVSAPFHCALMQPAADVMADALAKVAMKAPVVPVVANVGAAPLSDPAAIRASLVAQVTGTVRWRECVAYMAAQGVTRFYEIGAGKVLTGLSKKNAPDATAFAINTPDDIAAAAAQIKG